MSSGGQKRLVFNLNERIVSGDQSRNQALLQTARAELLRRQLFVSGDDGWDLGEGPLNLTQGQHEIVQGLGVTPSGGTFNFTVAPGLLLYQDPTYGDAEDSLLKEVASAGSPGGTLSIAPNTSGLVRVDVIRCKPEYTLTVEALETRDIYNQASNTFTATPVVKTRSEELLFDVAQGTPGAGAANPGALYVPLAVVLVPSGAANLDACTIWDVRRKLSEAEFEGTQIVTGRNATAPGIRRIEFIHTPTLTPDPTPGKLNVLKGQVQLSFNGKRVGGFLRRGTPGSDAAFSVDLGAVENQDTTSAPMVTPFSGNVYVYLCFPAGMPRWARFTDAPGVRTPRNPRGVPIASYVAPDDQMKATASIGVKGLGLVAGADCVCVATIPRFTGNKSQPASASGREANAYFKSVIALSANSTEQQFYLVPGNQFTNVDGFPAYARELRVLLTAYYDLPAVSDGYYFERVSVFNGGVSLAGEGQQVGFKKHYIRNSAGSLSLTAIEHELWIPNPLLHGTGFAGFIVAREWFSFTGAYNTTFPARVNVLGYRW
jgi:hypothetical protein